MFEPKEGSAVFLCGPSAMIQKAALPAERDVKLLPKWSGLGLTFRID